jgi:DNA-binding ferritin-like protein (Dps family)
MTNLFTKVLGDKKEWNAMQARANALPRDFRIAYAEMTSYMFKFATGGGMDVVAVLKEVLGLFETRVVEGKTVLEVTGQDVAAFCDQRLHGTTSYMDAWRSSLNRGIAQKLAE